MSNSRVLERRDIILRNGEWWAIPWWQQEQYYEDGLFTKEQAEAAFSELKKVFNPKWMLKQRDSVISKTKERLDKHIYKTKNSILLQLKEVIDDANDPSEAFGICSLAGFYSPHPLFVEFFGEGDLYFHDLVGLGINLLDARKKSLLRDSAKKLKNASESNEYNEYWSLRFELELLSHLIRLIPQEFFIERDYPSGLGNNNCDFKVSKGLETLFIEAKNLRLSAINLEINKLSNLIFSTIRSDSLIISTANILHLELSSDLRELGKTKIGLHNLWYAWETITQQIRDHIVERIANREWGHHIVPGIAEYDLHPREREDVGITGHFSGLSLSEEVEIKRLLSNAIEEGIVQLPQDGPGIIIIKTPLPLNSEEVERVVVTELQLQEDPTRFCHLSGIFLVYTYFRERLYYDINFIRNPQARFDVSSYAGIKAILSLNNNKENL